MIKLSPGNIASSSLEHPPSGLPVLFSAHDSTLKQQLTLGSSLVQLQLESWVCIDPSGPLGLIARWEPAEDRDPINWHPVSGRFHRFIFCSL